MLGLAAGPHSIKQHWIVSSRKHAPGRGDTMPQRCAPQTTQGTVNARRLGPMGALKWELGIGPVHMHLGLHLDPQFLASGKGTSAGMNLSIFFLNELQMLRTIDGSGSSLFLLLLL